MQNKSPVALALIIGGIVCLLIAFCAVPYLYHEHASQLIKSEDVDHFVQFVAIPSLLAFVVGGVLIGVGVMIRRGDKSP
jgi:hypothetical protein